MFRSLMLFVLLAGSATSALAQVPQESPRRLSIGASGGFAVEQSFGDYVPSGVRIVLGEINFNGALITSDGKPVLEELTAVVFGQSMHTGSRFIIGVGETFRFHTHPRRRFGTYIEAGAGEVSSALFTHIPETDGYFQYLLVGGTGFRWRSGRKTFTLGYRWVHFSNHGTLPSNQGLNLHTIALSYAHTL